MEAVSDYKPSAYYFRKALREAKTREDAVRVGLGAVSELENLKAWVREQGMIPPKRFVLPVEADAKGWRAQGR